MKRSIAVMIIAIVISLLFTLQPNQTPKPSLVSKTDKANIYKPVDRPHLQQLVEGRGAHEFLMTHDPKTNTIPKERLLPAQAYTQSLLDQETAIPFVNWEERGPNNVSGRTRSILIDAADPTGNTIFSGGVGGGIWRSTDGGTTWTQTNDFFQNMAIGDITQDPNNSSIIYFGTGEGYGNIDQIRGLGIWKSTDGGLSFTQLAATNNSNFFFVNSMVAVNNGGTTAVLAACGSGLQRSTDGGSTWTQVRPGNGVDMTVATNGDVYAGMDNDGIYKSTDAGATWTEVYNNTGGDGRIELAAAPSNSNVVYALVEFSGSSNVPTIRRTSDGGTTWPLVTNPLWNDQNCGVTNPDWTRTQDWYDLTVAVDPTNENRVFCGGVDLFLSSNGGGSWTQISSWAGACGRQFVHADQHALVFDPNNANVLWNGNDGGVFRTTNASAALPTFDFKGIGYNITQFYATDIHPTEDQDYFLAGAQDNGTQRFTMQGLNNTSSATGGDGAFCHIDQDNADIQITSFTRNNYSISTNGGASFGAGPRQNTGQFINPTDYDDESNILYGAWAGGSFFRWTDPATGGATWSSVTVAAIGATATHVRTSPNVSNRIYFGTSGRVVRVDNANTGGTLAGTTIFTDPGIPTGTISCLEIEEGDEDHMLVTLSNYGVVSIYETFDGNSASPSWTAVEGNLPDMPVRWVIFNPNDNDQAMIATELGVWSTDNLNGVSTDWDPTNASLANVRTDMLKYRASDKTVIAATHGRGLFSTNTFNNKLFFTKSTVSTANANDEITFELTAFNNKTNPVTNVVITDVLDAGFEYVPGSLTCGSISGNTITINLSSIAARGTFTCTFKARLPIDNASVIALEDDMESGDGNWTINNIQGAGTWSLNTTMPRSPSNAWYSPNTGTEDNTQFLTLDPISLPANAELGFWHLFNTESGWDGGFIEISTNGGSSWTDLGPNIIANVYNSVLGTNNNTNINGRDAWSGNSNGYVFTRVDLSSFGGQTAMIRFVFGEDDNTSVDGWYIDDVSIIQPYTVPNSATIVTAEGDNLSDQTVTLVFPCVMACFTCNDGIMNGMETDVDCGGPDCMACPTCTDGIMNGMETGVDCGGPECMACPTCTDGMMNGLETGVDCGGPDCMSCDCTETETDITYMDQTIPDGTLNRVKLTITTDSVDVKGSANVRLLAGQKIDVLNELEVEQGSVLELDTDDCVEIPAAQTVIKKKE